MEEFKAQLVQIIKERDEIRTELSHAKTAIVELENQNIELDRLLANAHTRLYANDSTRWSNPVPKASWIGTWKRSSPLLYPALVPVEMEWCNGNLQHALNLMPTMLERADFGHRHRTNARLLYSALIQSSGKNFHVALKYAEEALQIASELRLHELAGKAQFHRGMCYLYLCEYANAKWSFILASHLDDHAQTIVESKEKAEKFLRELPEGDPKRSITKDFRFFCHSEYDKFIYDESAVQSRIVYA